jgi:hypothetical protein
MVADSDSENSGKDLSLEARNSQELLRILVIELLPAFNLRKYASS